MPTYLYNTTALNISHFPVCTVKGQRPHITRAKTLISLLIETSSGKFLTFFSFHPRQKLIGKSINSFLNEQEKKMQDIFLFHKKSLI